MKTPVTLWLRLGDTGSYGDFGDDFDALADALHEAGVVADDISWLTNPAGLETSNYPDLNYVSLYWGDAEAGLVRPLNLGERAAVVAALRRVECVVGGE